MTLLSRASHDMIDDVAMFVGGSNAHGQLGLGHRNDVHQFTICNTPFSNGDILKIACGANHTAVLLRQGTVFVCGNNDNGQLGHLTTENDDKDVLEWSLLDIRAIFSSCNDFDTKQLDCYVKDVACGWNFTILLVYTNDSVYLIVLDDHSKTLSGLATGYPTIYHVPNEYRIQSITCGVDHVVILAQKENVSLLYTFGQNTRYALGHPTLPQKLNKSPFDPANIVKGTPSFIHSVSCGRNVTLFLGSEDGASETLTLYGFGSNRHQLLGLLPTIKDTGKLNTSVVRIPLPDNLELTQASTVSVGWSHVALLCFNSEASITKQMVYIWGKLYNSEDKRLLLKSDASCYIQCGSEHFAFLQSGKNDQQQLERNPDQINNNVLRLWGWNEHGNCGKEPSDVSNFFLPFESATQLRTSIRYIATGCATTFII